MSEHPILTHLARIRIATSERQTSLFRMLQERFGYEGESDTVYNFDAEISNSLLDSHFTRMSKKTLQNYAEDAQRGVAFLKGHNWRELPLGYSLSGDLQEVEGKHRVVSGFYTVLGSSDINDMVHRMKAGLVRDVSVGFGGGSYTCDICGRDYWDWDCRHIPGLKYEEKRGDETVTVLSTFTIDDARLSEVSGVFDGSTPDAMILRAQRVAEAGLLTPQQIDILENRYRVALPHKTVVAVPEIPKERKMEEATKDFERMKVVLVRTKTLTQEQVDTLDDTTLASAIEQLGERFSVAEAQAAEGRQYRKDLLEAALAEGVRAYGNEFEMETYRSHLENAPLALIKRQTADWKKTADAEIPAGRNSVDKEDRKSVVNTVPDAAFA